MSQYLEDSKTVKFADEADRFLFKELDEYYVPGEHEIIMFHLVTGLAFAQQGLRKKARVEAKRAADYLPGSFISSKYFDDPGIRMILAGLWLYCDEWQNAKANLKKASELSPKFKWAGTLAKKKQPPENFVIFLKGVGPEVIWAPDHNGLGPLGLALCHSGRRETSLYQNLKWGSSFNLRFPDLRLVCSPFRKRLNPKNDPR